MRIMAVSHPCVTDVNQQFYAELEALGHEIQLIVPSNFRHAYASTPVAVTRWRTFNGEIRQRHIGLSSSIPLHFYTTSLRPLIRNFNPDVLYVEEEPYSLSAWQAFYASRGLSMKRIIYSAQNITKKYPAPFKWSEQYVLERADMAAVVSEEVRTTIQSKGFRGQTLSFPLGVDTYQFRPSGMERRTTRSQLGLKDDFIVGYVGRLVEEKGIQNIIDAVPHFQGTDVRFLIVGNGPLLDRVKRIQQQHPNHVYVKSSVPHRDVQYWMNAMDVLLLPSLTMTNWKEQFGRVMLEALACKVPVIGSDSGEIPKLLTETGGGWIFPENDVAKMTQMIYDVRNNEQKRSLHAGKGYRSVLNKFSKRALAKSFVDKVCS